MLIQEMRGRDRNERNNSGSSSNSSDGGNNNSSTHTPQEETSHQNRPEQQSSSHSSNNGHSSDGIDVDDIDPPNSSYGFQSISERVQYYITKSVTWYQNQSEDMQTILKVSFALLILYIALGGRFGLEYAFQKQRRGNYGHGNAYERYNRQSTNYAARNNDRYGYVSESSSSRQSQGGNANRAQRQTESSGYNDRTNPQNKHYYSRYSQHDDDEQYYEPRQTQSTRRSSTTYHIPNLFDGSFTSMIILFIIGTICHRFGVNPFQIFWLLQATQRGGRHHHGGYGGYGGFGGMGGFGRRRVRVGRRGRW